jgi:mono/diheme cytochrome c family protein
MFQAPHRLLCHVAGWLSVTSGIVLAQSGAASAPSFAELKAEGLARSSFLRPQAERVTGAVPEPDLQSFRRDIAPILENACARCHGSEKQKGNVRIDTLDPDLFHGNDVDRWLDVLSVLSNGEMPPEDEAQLADADRNKVIEWLAAESHTASAARRAGKEHSSFRRMARYEYEYALQDLLGLPYDFADPLPPDPASPDGFENSSEVLHLSGIQFRAYREAARRALRLATVEGERPSPLFWSVSMESASAVEWARQKVELERIEKEHAADPEKLQVEMQRQVERYQHRPGGAHYLDRRNGRRAAQSWGYDGAKFAWAPAPQSTELPANAEVVAVIPRGQGLIVELGDQIPDDGTLRVCVRASMAQVDDGRAPSMQLVFGWQASNDSQASVRISRQDVVVDAEPGAPRIYQWDVPLSQIYPRNLVRKFNQLGDLPSPSEYLKLVNASVSGGDIHVASVEVTAPVYTEWPPSSHARIFFDVPDAPQENERARAVIAAFTARAWRREASAAEIEQKMRLYERLRPACDSMQEAVVEVLAAVLSSPHFLYLVESGPAAEAVEPDAVKPDAVKPNAEAPLSDLELATRLSMFLWCSVPDAELLAVAKSGQLRGAETLAAQVARMLADEKSQRFCQQFVRQWLGTHSLNYLHVDRKVYPQFDDALREAMREEPVAFFAEVLRQNHSVLEFLHADFTMANERLAKHYGASDVAGNQFRRIELQPEQRRGGLLTQAGLLAMNSDGKDSHPLKRGVWMLERLLDDPPPPPPAAVPEIDLADPEIAKMTLKQQLENHRNAAACMSCHVKIDPWGIAFENFDAVGAWRTEVQGQPVDAVGVLFNGQRLDGIDGLKRFLLENRQDQFVRAMVTKLLTFALGRPLTFGDHAAVDEIAAQVRQRGDGLASMVSTIATCALFRSK